MYGCKRCRHDQIPSDGDYSAAVVEDLELVSASGGWSRYSSSDEKPAAFLTAGQSAFPQQPVLTINRLGDRPREIGVHVTPTDFTPQQLKEVLARCKGLWNEKTLSRLAVPEMLEIDLPPDLMNPLRHYGDVEDIVTRNWPTRETMIRAEGADPDRFKRLLGLTVRIQWLLEAKLMQPLVGTRKAETECADDRPGRGVR